MREDTCANCNQRIYLVKTGPTSFHWVTDPDKPDERRCGEKWSDDPKLPERRHAPVSMRESHR